MKRNLYKSNEVGLRTKQRSLINELLLVVDLAVELVEVHDESVARERNHRLLERRVRGLQAVVQLLPPLVEALSVVLGLTDLEALLGFGVELERLLEGVGVDLLEDCLEGDEGLLQDPAG